MGYFETLLASWNDIDGGVNLAQYDDKEYDALLEKAHSAKTAEERSEILKEAAIKIGKDCPIAPLGYNHSFFFVRKGYEYTFNGMDLWGFYLKNVKINK